jgi:hypothetical protein
MNYLLDVNVLVAWGWSDHVDHERTAAWIGVARRRKATKLMTSAIPERIPGAFLIPPRDLHAIPFARQRD